MFVPVDKYTEIWHEITRTGWTDGSTSLTSGQNLHHLHSISSPFVALPRTFGSAAKAYTSNILAQWNPVSAITARLIARLESFVFAWYMIHYSNTWHVRTFAYALRILWNQQPWADDKARMNTSPGAFGLPIGLKDSCSFHSAANILGDGVQARTQPARWCRGAFFLVNSLFVCSLTSCLLLRVALLALPLDGAPGFSVGFSDNRL